MTNPEHVKELLKPKLAPMAKQLAMRWHNRQVDTATGSPYWMHLDRVAGRMASDTGKAVAWLHDILEDTEVLVSDLYKHGFPELIVRPVIKLTRFEEKQSYEDYINELVLSENPLAIHVKLADLIDHLHPNCPEHLKPRYYAALPIISKAAIDFPLVD